MKREVLWYHAAVEDVLQIAARNVRQSTRIMLAVREFGATSKGDVKKLSGEARWRLRVGDWRVALHLAGDLAYVLEIKDRQDAY